MGCFLACFGYSSKKRKRPKCSARIISSNQVHGGYVPLDSDVAGELESKQNSKALGSEYKGKVKKKVSFNLNVKTYEPLKYEQNESPCVSEGEDETKQGFNEEITQTATMLDWHHHENRTVPRQHLSSYRYQNIQDYYDEEDEIGLEESDLDDDNDDGFDEEEETFDSNGDEDDYAEEMVEYSELSSATADSDKVVSTAHRSEGRADSLMLSRALADGERNGTESDYHVRHRSQYVYSVLNPVENLTQWKAVKMRGRMQLKRQKGDTTSEQENQLPSETKSNLSNSDPLKHAIALDASLSNWLLSSSKDPITTVKHCQSQWKQKETRA